MSQPVGVIPPFAGPVPLPRDCPLGIGFIGAGSVVNSAHLPQYLKAGYRVVGCADLRPEAVEATQRRWNLSFATTDYRRLLERPEVAVVVVAIPPEDRLTVVREAAAAGKHILLEKPLAHRYAEAVAMVQAAENAGVKLAVNQNRRWMAPHWAARWLLEQGAIGTPYFAVYTGRSNQEYLVGSWYERYRHFLLIEFCVHHLDLLVFWLGEPEAVLATTSRSPAQRFAQDMTTCVTLLYPDHRRAQLCLNDVARHRLGDEFWLEGTTGLIRTVSERELALVSDQTGGALVQQTLPPTDSFAASMGDLLLAIQENREPLCSGRRNLATLRTVLAACRAAEERRAVPVAEIAQEEA